MRHEYETGFQTADCYRLMTAFQRLTVQVLHHRILAVDETMIVGFASID